MSKSVWVYAHWHSMEQPELVGILEVDLVRDAEVYRFAYAESWLSSPFVAQIDPQLKLFSGDQFNNDARNFRIFFDSCPDSWGCLLMQRREAVLARQEGRRVQRLNESDYLLGVHDICRIGALRFKLSDSGPFLDSNERLAAPPFSSLRELEYAVSQIELNQDLDHPDYLKWLFMLISPGSSLGGARPKACVSDGDELWLAKFPSHYDGDDGASYLELAQFLIEQGANTQADLAQLWRRLVFNILVSNSDDHLRNHGFILADNVSSGWLLSPAYDINVIQGATGLHLNIDDYSNELSLDLALEVAPYFQLSAIQSKQILTELRSVTDSWQHYANEIGINRQEQQLLESILF